MATTESKYAGDFIVDDKGEHSREAIVVLSGQVLQAGHVVGRVSLGIGGAVSVLSGTSPGNGTMTAITAGPDVEVGAYLVQCKTVVANGGVFSVTSPSGKVLPDATITPGAGGTCVYTSSHINFTLTDGSTDFAATALFTVTVSTTAPLVLGGTGTGTISALSLGPNAKPGTYTVVNIEAIANGGRFQVFSPDGDSLGEFLMTAGAGAATAFANPDINFTLTDATDFILGNSFAVVVHNALAGGKVVEWDPRAADARRTVVGIAYDNYDATAADVRGVIEVRWAVVNGDELVWKAGLTAGEIASGKAALTAMGVVVR